MTSFEQIRYYEYAGLPEPAPNIAESGPSLTTDKIPRPIRIFTLHPGHPEDSLQGELSVREDDELFEALSYWWGPSGAENGYSEPHVRILAEKREVRTLQVRPNLALALRHLRHVNRSRILWVDSLCINQDDRHEKSGQIAMMDKIFKNAQNVCIWLGDGDENSELALQLIDRILKLDDFDHLVEKRPIEEWAALSHLMKRDWFSRRWVVQEIGYARQATVHCGKQSIEWSALADAVALFASRAPDISERFRKDPTYGHQIDYLGDVTALGATRLVDTTGKLFRKSDKGQHAMPLLSLEALVSRLSAFKASQPHDIIYATLSLANDTIRSAEDEESRRKSAAARAPRETVSSSGTITRFTAAQRKQASWVIGVLAANRARKLFPIDYVKKFFDVCKDFIDFTIKRSESLDMLCRPWAPEKEDLPAKDRTDLPSWICQLNKSPLKERHDGNYSRVNADLLVGEADAIRRRYNAASNTKPDGCRVGSEDYPRSLFATGFVLDEIAEMKGPALEGNVPHQWLEFGGWHDTSTEQPPESFWRTIVADRDFNGLNPPSYYRRACHHAFARRPKGAALNTDKQILNEKSQVIKDFLHRVQAVVWMRSLIKTKRVRGLDEIPLGLAPSDAQVGDLVCILRGCSVPVIVRALPQDVQDLTRPDMPLEVVSAAPPVILIRSDPPAYQETATMNGKIDDAGPPGPNGASSPDAAVKDHVPAPLNQVRDRSTHSDSPSEPFSPLGGSKEDPWKKKKVLPCQLIGECYLHGMMDGEAMRARDEYDIGENIFRIE